MNNQTQEKKFVCKSCGSKASGTPGTCCGAEREAVSVCMACECPCDKHKEHNHPVENKSNSHCGC